KSVAPGGRLFAFEINKSIAETLQRTMARNALNEVALVIGQGAGASVSQSLTTVDTLLQTGGTRNVGFIKVDTDGSDYDVLRGATKTLNASQAVVAVEMSQRQQEIFELLRSCGYSYFQAQDGTAVTPGCWPENLIASKRAVT